MPNGILKDLSNPSPGSSSTQFSAGNDQRQDTQRNQCSGTTQKEDMCTAEVSSPTVSKDTQRTFGKDVQRTIPKNLGTDHAQLAPNTHSLSSPDEDYHDNEVSRNFILLTPVKIGPQKASLYTNPNSAQQHSPPVCLSANPKPNQTTHGGQLTLSPNSISPKIVNNLSKSYNMNHSDLTPRIHPNQNSLTTSKKNNPRITQLWKTTKLHPPLSKPQATNQKRKVPKLRLIFSQKTEESC